MPGGSYDYLYRVLWGAALHKDALQRMAARLEALGTDASDETRVVVDLIVRVEHLADPLRELWKAVEWFDSGDGEEEALSKALQAWRLQRAPDPQYARLLELQHSAEAQAAHFLREKERALAELEAVRSELEQLRAQLTGVECRSA